MIEEVRGENQEGRARPCDIEIPQLLQDMVGDLTSAPEPVVIKLFAQDPVHC